MFAQIQEILKQILRTKKVDLKKLTLWLNWVQTFCFYFIFTSVYHVNDYYDLLWQKISQIQIWNIKFSEFFFLIIHLFLIQILFSPLFETHQSSWSLKLSHIKEYITSGFDMFCCNNCLINDREKHSEQEFLPQDDFIYSYNFIIKHFFIIWFNKVTENRKNKFLIFSFI